MKCVSSNCVDDLMKEAVKLVHQVQNRQAETTAGITYSRTRNDKARAAKEHTACFKGKDDAQ